jgi:hypothetical protein
MTGADDADEPIAKVLALHQHEDDHHQDERRCRERFDQWTDPRGEAPQRGDLL